MSIDTKLFREYANANHANGVLEVDLEELLEALADLDAARAELATVREEHAKLTAVVIDLEAQNRLFRAETKSCADCDGVTLAEVTTLRAELEAERRKTYEVRCGGSGGGGGNVGAMLGPLTITKVIRTERTDDGGVIFEGTKTTKPESK